MNVLLFITGFRHVKEYDHFNSFLQRLDTLGTICDLYIHCNNPDISEEIVTYYKKFTQKNKHLYITSTNIGFEMGAVEAVSHGIEAGVFAGYDYVLHLHPDVFITDDARIIEILETNLDNDCVFFVNKSRPDDDRFFSFDFFIFKPRLLKTNIFKDGLYSHKGKPEHHLHDLIVKNDVKFQIVRRFDDDDWFPRRVDENLGLYHEHDMAQVEALLQRRAPPWPPPVVELRASTKTKP